MEMQQIRYFLTLTQTLNFTRAAEACNVTQPALTRAVQALEAELGGELIRRERQLSHLTELGRRMLPLMQQCYEAATSAQALARAVKSSNVAPLSLGIALSINISTFMPTISELFRAYPGLQLKIRRGSSSDIGKLLKEGDVDLAIAGPLGEVWERVDTWPLFVEPIELAFGRDHMLARRNEIELRHLVGERVLGRAKSEIAHELTERLRAHGLTAVPTHEVETDYDLLALVESGAGIGFVPASAPDSPAIRRQTVKDLDVRRAVSVYAVAGRQRTPVTTALLNLLRAADWPYAEARTPP
jgi:DNA-binding transcriptional LysR family regulator